jgi:hypothetical protein
MQGHGELTDLVQMGLRDPDPVLLGCAIFVCGTELNSILQKVLFGCSKYVPEKVKFVTDFIWYGTFSEKLYKSTFSPYRLSFRV